VRDESTIRQKFKQVCYRHLKKLLKDNFRKQPHTCKFNKMVPVGGDPSRQVGFCNHPDVKGRPICDMRVEGCPENARECPLWEARQEKARIKGAFYDLVNSKARGPVASEYPDIAALLWVLDSPDVTEDCNEVDNAIDQIPDEELWQ